MLGDGGGRQQRSAGLLGCRELRTADPELTQSERGFIKRSAALRVGPERHAVGAHAVGVGERVVVCRAAARRAALRCTRAELRHVTARRTAAARRQQTKARKGAGEHGETNRLTRHLRKRSTPP